MLAGARSSDAAATAVDDRGSGHLAQRLGTRFVGLAVATLVAGLSLGIVLSLAFVIGLNSLNLG